MVFKSCLNVDINEMRAIIGIEAFRPAKIGAT